MFINQLPFLTGIDGTIKYRMIATLKTREHDEFFVALDKFLRAYNAAGFVIKKIHADGEFEPMMAIVQDELDVQVNCTTAGEHVGIAERNNQTIKERVRVGFHRTPPYKAIPKVMVQELAIGCTDSLNFFPVKGGVSSYYSPHMIMHQENLDYNKHCLIAFGSFVQAEYNVKPTNTQVSRVKDAIYLRPIHIDQGGHLCMDLHTGARFKTRKVTVLPITQVVIDAVNKLGKRYGQVGLKFDNRFGVIMQDADQITGVVDEYQFQEDHKDNSEDEEDSDHNDSSISDSSSNTGSSDSDGDDDDDNGEDDEEVDADELHDVLEEILIRSSIKMKKTMKSSKMKKN
jgi:hypothetical protein